MNPPFSKGQNVVCVKKEWTTWPPRTRPHDSPRPLYGHTYQVKVVSRHRVRRRFIWVLVLEGFYDLYAAYGFRPLDGVPDFTTQLESIRSPEKVGV